MIKTEFHVYDEKPELGVGVPIYHHHLVYHVEEESTYAIFLKKDDIAKHHEGKIILQEGEF